jgi:agmatine/peptidylarginine deiminase
LTYGLKIIIAEKSMSLIEAKGVHDRTFSYTAYPGDSTFDIKETLNPQGYAEYQKRLNELFSFRKLLFIYRLLHFKDTMVNIDTGLKRRNRKLVKPIIQLFSSAEPHIQKEISSTLEGFLKAKQTRKENTIDAALCPIATNLVSEHGKEIAAKYVWNVIVKGDIISGYYDDKRPNEFQSADYGTLYRNTITNIICDKLGAKT